MSRVVWKSITQTFSINACMESGPTIEDDNDDDDDDNDDNDDNDGDDDDDDDDDDVG